MQALPLLTMKFSMRKWIFLVPALAILLSRPQVVGRRRPDLSLLEFKAQREDELISVHARVKNIGAKTLPNVSILFRFIDTEGATVTTQRAELEATALESGQETEVEGQMKDAPRAVHVLVLATRTGGVDLRVENAGPFDIE